ncbi:MAG: Trp biosynthesis-associated membrane protein, partial [Streptosporangiaceae bacterium]
ATSGWLRRVLGVLLVLLGAGIGAVSATATGHAHIVEEAGYRSRLFGAGSDLGVTTNAWWTVSLAGGLLLAAAGVLTAVRGARWPGMSARYDAVNAVPKKVGDDPAGLWKSLDRGEDPTRADPSAEHLDAP